MADKKQKQKKPSTFASLKQRWSGYRLKSQISKTVSRVEAGKDVSTVEATRAAGIIDAKTKRKQKQLNTAQAKVNNIKGQYSKKIRNNIQSIKSSKYQSRVNKKYSGEVSSIKKQIEKELKKSGKKFNSNTKRLENQQKKKVADVEKQISKLKAKYTSAGPADRRILNNKLYSLSTKKSEITENFLKAKNKLKTARNNSNKKTLQHSAKSQSEINQIKKDEVAGLVKAKTQRIFAKYDAPMAKKIAKYTPLITKLQGKITGYDTSSAKIALAAAGHPPAEFDKLKSHPAVAEHVGQLSGLLKDEAKAIEALKRINPKLTRAEILRKSADDISKLEITERRNYEILKRLDFEKKKLEEGIKEALIKDQTPEAVPGTPKRPSASELKAQLNGLQPPEKPTPVEQKANEMRKQHAAFYGGEDKIPKSILASINRMLEQEKINSEAYATKLKQYKINSSNYEAKRTELSTKLQEAQKNEESKTENEN